jgi:hypothetical protein
LANLSVLRMIGMNTGNSSAAESPFGGIKESGEYHHGIDVFDSDGALLTCRRVRKGERKGRCRPRIHGTSSFDMCRYGVWLTRQSDHKDRHIDARSALLGSIMAESESLGCLLKVSEAKLHVERLYV